jgi:hypothetical protein
MFDVPDLLHRADLALKAAPEYRIANGWPARKIEGRVWHAASFDAPDGRWSAVRGAQRPGAAQLLDAAAAYLADQRAKDMLANTAPPKHVLAIIQSDGEHEPAPASFRRRFQAAVWHGLDVVWVEDDGVRDWESGAPPDETDKAGFNVIADACSRALEGAFRSDPKRWSKLARDGKSLPAEELVRTVLTAVLQAHEFSEAPAKERKFDAFWRTARADGLWTRSGAKLTSLALEVKAGEDASAPLNQVMDDLGVFDGVLQVRILPRGRKTTAPRGMEEAKRRVSDALPVRYISLLAP